MKSHLKEKNTITSEASSSTIFVPYLHYLCTDINVSFYTDTCRRGGTLPLTKHLVKCTGLTNDTAPRSAFTGRRSKCQFSRLRSFSSTTARGTSRLSPAVSPAGVFSIAHALGNLQNPSATAGPFFGCSISYGLVPTVLLFFSAEAPHRSLA